MNAPIMFSYTISQIPEYRRSKIPGGIHPSTYPNSEWPEGFNHGDFKPDTSSGAKTFYNELNSGKLSPDTVPLPYDPKTMSLKNYYYFGPREMAN